MTTRDLTFKQFRAACERAGFVPEGFFGYYRLPVPGHVAVSAWNAGDSRRAQLAYLHRRTDEELRKAERGDDR